MACRNRATLPLVGEDCVVMANKVKEILASGVTTPNAVMRLATAHHLDKNKLTITEDKLLTSHCSTNVKVLDANGTLGIVRIAIAGAVIPTTNKKTDTLVRAKRT
jgi:hypothetical protein